MNELNQMTWKLLPDSLLLKIFNLLEESDMVHASSTCTRWRRMFYEPRFWRSVTFDFNHSFQSPVDIEMESDRVHASSTCTRWRKMFYEPRFWRSVRYELNQVCKSYLDNTSQRLQTHLLTIGSFVEDVSIICPKNRLPLQENFTDCVKVILETLASVNRSIRSFQMLGLNMMKAMNRFDRNKCNLIHVLIHFLESQTCLRTLVISKALLPTTFGHMFITSLAKSPSVDTLQHLDISYLYAFDLGSSKEHGKLIESVIKNCPRLIELTLNYGLLKDINVENLCEAQYLIKLNVKSSSCIRCQSGRSFAIDNDRESNNDNSDEDEDPRQNDDAAQEVGSDEDDNEDEDDHNEDNVDDHQQMSDEEIEADDDSPPIKINRWRKAIVACPNLRVSLELNASHVDIFSQLSRAIPVSHLTVFGISSSGRLVGIKAVLRHITKRSYETLESAHFVGRMYKERLARVRSKEARQDDYVNFLLKYPNIRRVQFSADLFSFDMLEKVRMDMLLLRGQERDVVSIV